MVTSLPLTQFPSPQWNSTYLAFSLIVEGITEKVLQIIILLSQFTFTTVVSMHKKLFLNTAERNNNKSINWHYFCHDKFFSVDLFRAALYRFIKQ